MGKRILLVVVGLIMLGTVAYFFRLYSSQILKYKNSQQSQLSNKEKSSEANKRAYNAQSVTYNMQGQIVEINSRTITVEDKTPQSPLSQQETGNKIIQIRLARNGIIAKGNSYILLQDLKVGDQVLLKTSKFGEELFIDEAYVLAS